MKAHEFLATALTAMEERAKLRDSEGGERSMAATVKAFNAIRKTNLTEEDGWAFMVLLKLVRSTNGVFHADDYVDGAAYFGLLGEAAEKERVGDKPLSKEKSSLEIYLGMLRYNSSKNNNPSTGEILSDYLTWASFNSLEPVLLPSVRSFEEVLSRYSKCYKDENTGNTHWPFILPIHKKI